MKTQKYNNFLNKNSISFSPQSSLTKTKKDQRFSDSKNLLPLNHKPKQAKAESFLAPINQPNNTYFKPKYLLGCEQHQKTQDDHKQPYELKKHK